MKAPMSRSRVNPSTPSPVVKISIVDGPYNANPAHTCAVPGCRKCPARGSAPGSGLRKTEKMVPAETLASRLPDPSSGSNTSRYFPRRWAAGTG